MAYCEGYESQPILIPYVAGIPWSKDQHDPLPRTPILSAIQLSLRPGVDVCDLNQSAARLWEASLDYVCSIPNCTALYWAPLKDQPEILVVLLQWESALAWKHFQESVGFGLMVGLLTPNCFNRAVRLQLPSGSHMNDYSLELVSFEFPGNDSTDSREQFTTKWEDFSGRTASENGFDLIISGGWVEPDGPYYFISPEAHAMANTQPRYFLGLLFWKTATGAENIGAVVRQKATALSVGINAIKSIMTTPLRKESGRSHERPSAKFPTIETASSLLSICFPRKYRRENGFWKSVDLVNSKSLNDQREKKRLYPGPRAIYIAMGRISQHSLPKQQVHVSSRDIDLFWLKPTRGEEIPWRDFYNLQTRVDMDFRAKISRGRANNKSNNPFLVVWWESPNDRTYFLRKTHDKIKNIASAYHYSIEGPPQKFFGAGIFSGNYELVSFYMPLSQLSAVDKSLFELAYSYFESTMHLRVPGGSVQPACAGRGGGWDDDPILRRGTQVLRFSSMISWHNKDAYREWYSDFARGAMESYERLGHIIDRFKLLKVEVESLFISVDLT